jgi:hypothetical protein
VARLLIRVPYVTAVTEHGSAGLVKGWLPSSASPVTSADALQLRKRAFNRASRWRWKQSRRSPAGYGSFRPNDGTMGGNSALPRPKALRYNRREKWEIETKLLAVVVDFACVGFLGRQRGRAGASTDEDWRQVIARASCVAKSRRYGRC